MKKLLPIAALTALSLSVPLAFAEDAHHADKDKKPATSMSDKDKQMHMSKMQENMLRMHEQMHKIMEAKTTQDRERHMQEHSKMMHDSMHMMKDKMGGKMDGGMKGK